MKKTLTGLICLLSLFTATGCATLFAPKTQKVYSKSEPAGADVYVNGTRMGTTPLTLDLKPDKQYVLEFKKEGFKTIGITLNTKVGAGWVILDVVGGLIPVIVDAATGAWKKLDQDNVNAILEKQ